MMCKDAVFCPSEVLHKFSTQAPDVAMECRVLFRISTDPVSERPILTSFSGVGP